MGAVRIRVQTADKNITIIHKQSPVHQLTSCEENVYISWLKKSKNMQIKPHTQQLSPVDSLMAHQCIKCAAVALLPVDWVYYQEISIIAKCPFPLNEPLFKLFHNALSCSAFTCNRLQNHFTLSFFSFKHKPCMVYHVILFLWFI